MTGTITADAINLNRGLFDFGNNTLSIDTTGKIEVATFNLTGGTLQGDTVDFNSTTGTFNFTGGTLAVDTFNGTLNQTGSTVAPGNTPCYLFRSPHPNPLPRGEGVFCKDL
jgi:hypothetical protein